MEIDDLKLIKKYYGEKMSHLCRDLFPTILEQKGALFDIISQHFTKSKSLYYDIILERNESLFKDYIYSFFDVERTNKEIVTKSAKELLAERGYILYECKNFEDVLKFKKYYAPNEGLCTFKDPHRIDNHHIFFIVKKDVENIKREDFDNPKREDEYGVSVLDLQFDKGDRQRVSIKSRYNHHVSNPDATYSNNLEYIALGLTEAFERDYGFNIGKESKIGFELKDYIEARDGKNYKYNYEINNIHYCLDNIIIDDGKVIDIYADKSRYTFMDYFILDEVNKKIIIYDKEIEDSFVDDLQDIESIEIRNNKEEGYKEVRLKLKEDRETIIKLDKRGRIISYKNDYLKMCYDNFLYYNKSIATLDLPELEKCNDDFLRFNVCLKTLNLPKLKECRDGFLYTNDSLETLTLPKLKICGHSSLSRNTCLETLILPKLEICGDDFLRNNRSITTIDLPELKYCGDSFLRNNTLITTINLPKLEECMAEFLFSNNSLITLNLPHLKKCYYSFLSTNRKIIYLNLPELEECGNCFLYNNTDLTTLYLPHLKKCGDMFFADNVSFVTLYLPRLKECGSRFLSHNQTLMTLDLPELEKYGNYFLEQNYSLTTFNLPKIAPILIEKLKIR